MKKSILAAVIAGVLGLIFWSMARNLQTEPAARSSQAAIILRAPADYRLEDIGPATLSRAVTTLLERNDPKAAVRYEDRGDKVILYTDHAADAVVELRASRTGTLVERYWPSQIERRLSWAVDQGTLEPPGSPPPSGKNLYH